MQKLPFTHTTEPLVLLIGTLNQEGITSTLRASGREYKLKRLNSYPQNWATICDLFQEFDIKCVVMKLSGIVYEHLADLEYEIVRDMLVEKISSARHAIFVHEDLLTGAPEDAEAEHEQADDDDVYFREIFHRPSEEVRKVVNDFLMQSALNVLPYRTNAELTVMASSFIVNSEEGLIFRVYVADSRLWSNETDRLVQLFRDYLIRVAKLSIRLDQRRTEHGIIYEFFHATEAGQIAVNDDSLSDEFRNFSALLDYSLSDPAQAEEILRSKQLESGEILTILTRYAKEAKRIQVDLKHEREQKILSIRQRLESELVDLLPTTVSFEALQQLADSAVPPLRGVASVFDSEGPRLITPGEGPVTVNIQPQFINAVNSIVAQEMQGDVHLSEMDHKLLSLIREHAPERQTELASAVRELADSSAPQSGRLLAKQRLKAFLYKVGGTVGDVGTSLLISYLEKRFGLS